MESKLPIVSVVITTKNEESNIGSCLESITQQSYPRSRIEIIVVDNRSADKTKLIANHYTNKVFDKGPERSAQRNYGLTKAKGKFLLYLDADMTLSDHVIRECVNKISNEPEIIGLYIPEIVTGDGYWSQVRRFERSFYNATVIDCVRFLRSADFRAVRGFDTSITGPEDWDFDKKIRLRGKVALISKPIFHNESHFNLVKYLSKKSYYATSFDRYISKWGRQDPDVNKQFSPYYRYIGVFLENGKWTRILTFPHLFLGVLLLRFLVGLSYIKSQLTR